MSIFLKNSYLQDLEKRPYEAEDQLFQLLQLRRCVCVVFNKRMLFWSFSAGGSRERAYTKARG